MPLLLLSWDLRELRKVRLLEEDLNLSGSQRLSDFFPHTLSLHIANSELLLLDAYFSSILSVSQ